MVATRTDRPGDIDLSPEQAQEVRNILGRLLPCAEGEQAAQAWVFGSRATGRARPYSDLDILIETPQALDWRARSDLEEAFEASNLPFRVDVVEASRLAPGMAARVMAERLSLIPVYRARLR